MEWKYITYTHLQHQMSVFMNSEMELPPPAVAEV